jgi:hypothetical protein
MTLTPAELDVVESMAQEHIRYQKIWHEQEEVLKKDQVDYAQALERVMQSPSVAKPGQRWRPTEGKVDEYLAHCDNTCLMVPRNSEE